MHQLWLCPCNFLIDIPDVQTTQHYAGTARTAAVHNPSFWLRGFLHYGMLTLPIAYPECAFNFSFGANVHWTSGVYCGDGAGGQFGAFQELRRCGVGVAFLHQQLDKFVLASAGGTPLLGEVQTVPRAEALAIYIVVLTVAPGSMVEYVGDNQHIMSLAQKPLAAARSCHSGLFAEIFKLIDEFLSVTFLWLPSHTKTGPSKRDQLPERAQSHHIDGNEVADTKASRVAKLCQVGLEISKPYVKSSHQAGRVQARYTALLKHSKTPTRPEEPQNSRARDILWIACFAAPIIQFRLSRADQLLSLWL